jgi:hypothetical protein
MAIGVAGMQRTAGPAVAAKHIPLLGMLGSSFGTALVVDPNIFAIGTNRFCATPHHVKLRIGYFERTIFIAKEAQSDACLLKEIRDHELNHARIDDEVLDAYVPILTDQIRAAVAQVNPLPAATADIAETTLAADIGARVSDLVQALKQERNRRQAALDSPEELTRLRALRRLGRGQGRYN